MRAYKKTSTRVKLLRERSLLILHKFNAKNTTIGKAVELLQGWRGLSLYRNLFGAGRFALSDTLKIVDFYNS